MEGNNSERRKCSYVSAFSRAVHPRHGRVITDRTRYYRLQACAVLVLSQEQDLRDLVECLPLLASRGCRFGRRSAGPVNASQGGHDAFPYDAAGHRRSPATMRGFHHGRSPRSLLCQWGVVRGCVPPTSLPAGDLLAQARCRPAEAVRSWGAVDRECGGVRVV